MKVVNSDFKDKNKPQGLVIGIDKQQIYPIEGVEFLGNCDFTTQITRQKVLNVLNGRKVNCVLSDMVKKKYFQFKNLILIAI